MLTYTSFCFSLYRWALPGSDFYFQSWPPQGVAPPFQYFFWWVKHMFDFKTRCPVMLTYTRFWFSLYRWALPGSDFENDVDIVHIMFFCFYWKPILWEVNQASLSPKVAARWCSPIQTFASPYIGEHYRAATLKMIWIDFILFCLFLLKTHVVRSESSKLGSKSRCPVMLTYRKSCLSLYRWALPGSDFENDMDRFHIIFFVSIENPSCEKWIKQVWVQKSLPGDAHL